MATKSFTKNFKIDPSVANNFRNKLVSVPKETKEERMATRETINNNNENTVKLLAKFSYFYKK